MSGGARGLRGRGPGWSTVGVEQVDRAGAILGGQGAFVRGCWWNPTLNHDRGGWALAATGVSFTATFTPTSKTSPGTFGITINYKTVLPQPTPQIRAAALSVFVPNRRAVPTPAPVRRSGYAGFMMWATAVVWASIVRSGPTATLPDAAFGATHALEAAVVSPQANRTGRDATVRPPHNDDSDIGFRRLVVRTPKQAGRGAQG